MSLDPGRQVIGIVAAEEGLDPGLARQRQAAGQQDLGALMVGDRHRIEQVEQSGQHRIEIGPLPFRADRLGRLVGQRLEQGDAESTGAGRTEDLDTDIVETTTLGLPAEATPATAASDRPGLEGRMIGELPDGSVGLGLDGGLKNWSHGGLPVD